MSKENQRKKATFWVIVYSCIDSVVGAILMGILLISFLFRQAGVIGSSMLPTLEENQRLFVIINNGLWSLKRGDIVVINQPTIFNESLIKRVIGIGGDKIDIDFETGTVYLNGKVLNEPYINSLTKTPEGVEFPYTVPPGHVFAMGDNRNASTDSRCPGVGVIDERYVNAKVIWRIWPPNKFGRVR